MDEDPLICYGEVRVFMCLFGVACDTAPAPPELYVNLFDTVPHLLALLLLELCVDLLTLLFPLMVLVPVSLTQFLSS